MLLTLAFTIPVNEDNRLISYDIMEKEGWYPMVPIMSASLDTYFHSYQPGVLDDSSDGIMLRTAFDAKGENAFLAAMDMSEYSRYWHGYVSVLRPLLAVFDYGEIRAANAMGQLLLVALLFLSIYRKLGMKYSILALTSYCLLMPLAMPFSLQYSWVFYITYGFLLYLTSRKEEQISNGIKLYWIFMIVGMLTSYFDLLTYPLYTWGIPIIWWLLLQTDNQKESCYVKKVVCTGVWWLAGYAGMWATKWLLGGIALKRNIFENAFEKGEHWLNADNGLLTSRRLEAIYNNWKHYEYKLYVILLLAWLFTVFICSMRNGMVKNAKNKALLLVSASPVVWYFNLSEHTAVHHFFTHRAWGIAILAILALLIISTEGCSLPPKERYVLLAVWGVCGVLAVGLALLPKEDILIINGSWDHREVQVREGEFCEMSFTPSFPIISQFGLCAAGPDKGVCKIAVMDGKTTLYEEDILMEEYQNTGYVQIPVSWKLEKEKEYSMHISFEDIDSEACLLVTLDQNRPMSEYGEAKLEGREQGGQILSGIVYRYRALSKWTLCSLWIAWSGLLVAVWASAFARRKVNVN